MGMAVEKSRTLSGLNMNPNAGLWMVEFPTPQRWILVMTMS
jgi:hypothetical protein